jgi:hypothetical protein
VGRLFAFYNERTTSEAFICASRHVYNIQNLRARKFAAIYTNAKVKPAWSGARPMEIPPWLWFRPSCALWC